MSETMPARLARIGNQLMPNSGNALALFYTAQTQTGGPDTLDLSELTSSNRIDQIQAVFIDNSNGGSPFLLSIANGTSIKCPPLAQGWVPLIAPFPPQLTFSGAGAAVPLFFTNVPMPVGFWATGASGGTAVWTSFSGVTPNPAGSGVLFPANSARKSVLVSAPLGGDLWVNPIGGVAGVSQPDCFRIPAGATYESQPGEPVTSEWTFYCVATSLVYTALSGA